MHAAPDTVIAGRYRLFAPLGEGGMGAVWIARHLQLDVDVALKLMTPALLVMPSARPRFEREAKAAAKLRSPHVVQVMDYGVEGDSPFIVMELLAGESLKERLDRVGRLSLPEASSLLAQLAKALGVAHAEGIVHRDLKPANIFYAKVGEDEVVKVLDFGIAKETDPTLVQHVTVSGIMLGSPLYMSPEQARSAHDVDHRSDLWSVGVLLYQAIVGDWPFKGPTPLAVMTEICSGEIPKPSRARPELGPEMDAFFEHALARNREQRFQSAREMAEAFSRADKLPIAAASRSAAEPRMSVTIGTETGADRAVVSEGGRSEAKSRPLPKVIGAILAVMVALGAFMLVRHLERSDSIAPLASDEQQAPVVSLTPSSPQPAAAETQAPSALPSATASAPIAETSAQALKHVVKPLGKATAPPTATATPRPTASSAPSPFF